MDIDVGTFVRIKESSLNVSGKEGTVIKSYANKCDINTKDGILFGVPVSQLIDDDNLDTPFRFTKPK